MKKTLSLLLVLAMVLGSFSFAFAAPAVEMDAEKAGEFLKKEGVLEGSNGDLMLDKPLKRQDSVVLLSRLMKAEEDAAKFPVTEEYPTFKDITDKYYTPYLAWAQANKYVEGHSAEKFGYGDFLTAQQYATVLLRALGYEQDVDFKYEEALAKAEKLGILTGLKVEDKTEITRGQMSVMAYNALAAEVKGTGKTLAEKLEIVMPAPEKLEVKEVVADNLKEIKVVFNKAVDEESATNADNYEAPKDIKDITYLENENTAILLLEEAMTNKKAYELVIKGVKDDKNTLDVTQKFTAVDNAIPEVVEVVGLGTKAAKIVVSEPIKEDVAKQTKNYRLDGKAYYGGVEVVGREIILRPYNTLSVGEHELTVKGLEDFAGLKSIETLHKFEIKEDKDAPEVVDATGTLERVVVEFNEDIDPNSVKTSNVYWKNGSTKQYPRAFARIAGNKYAFEFSTDKALPLYETTLYIENFADYSGNTMKAVERAFKGTIDETRPVVLKAELDETAKVIVVKFNKAVDGSNKDYYTLVNDETGKTVPVRKVVKENDKVWNLELFNELSAGKTYTLKVEKIKDLTRLQNTMVPSEHKIAVDDYKLPEFVSASANKDKREVYVIFSKNMDLATIANPANYLFKVKNADKAMSLGNVSGVDVTVVQDGKAVIVELPKKVDGKEVDFAKNNYQLAVLGVKDLAGNLLENYGKFMDISTEKPVVLSVVAGDSETVEIEFSQPILEVKSNSAFDVDGAELKGISGKGTKIITLTVDELKADASNKLTIDKDYLVTFTGAEIDLTGFNGKITDEIKPSLDKVEAKVVGTDVVLTLVFDENVKYETGVEKDIKLQKADGSEIKNFNVVKFEDKNIEVKVALTEVGKDTYLRVKLDNPKFITDIAGNKANSSDFMEAKTLIEATKPAAKAAAETAVNAIPVTINASNLADAKAKVKAAEDANKAAKAVGWTDEEIAAWTGTKISDAKTTIATVEETSSNQQKADAVAKLIRELPSPVTLDDKAKVQEAKIAFDGLTSTQQGMIASDLNAKLTNSVDEIAVLEAKEALQKSINVATELYDSTATAEGLTVGNYDPAARVALNEAISTANTALSSTSAIATSLQAAKTALDNAVKTFKESKIVAIDGLKDITVVTSADNTENTVSYMAGNSLVVKSSDVAKATVAEDTTPGTIKVTGVAAGVAEITVQIKNASGIVIQAGTFTVTVE